MIDLSVEEIRKLAKGSIPKLCWRRIEKVLRSKEVSKLYYINYRLDMGGVEETR